MTFDYITARRKQPTAKFEFDPKMWVVWANSQFATVFGVLVSFFFLPFLFSSARLQVDESSPITKDVPFGNRIFNFHISAYFAPKIIKIKPEIGNFKRTAET